jgi:hypothetical protein
MRELLAKILAHGGKIIVGLIAVITIPIIFKYYINTVVERQWEYLWPRSRISIQEEVKKLELGKSRDEGSATSRIKERFINIKTISLHYVDKNEVHTLYNDYFKEPTIEKVVEEISKEASGDIKAEFPKLLEAKAGGKNLSKWVSTIKIPDISTNEMFRKYQSVAILNNEVELGLEALDIELTEVESFDSIITELDKRFQFKNDESQINVHKQLLKRRAAEKVLERLEKVSGWVLVDGKFSINDSPDGYELIYVHPVNEYIADEAKKITLLVILKKDAIESSSPFKYSQSVGRIIPLKVYGKIWQPLNRNSDKWEIQIHPLAIY